MQLKNDEFLSPVALLFHTYNSLFLSLPFQDIELEGSRLALFNDYCHKAYEAGKSPRDIVEGFWEEENLKSTEQRFGLLQYFIRYVERQVVLFDSVEDSLFEETHDMNGAGTLRHFLTRFNTPQQKAALRDFISNYSLRMVLTAHPTQFYPGKVLGIINDLVGKIRDKDLADIRLLLMQLGKTSFINKTRPTPYDEAVSLGWYLQNVFYEVLPDILFRLIESVEDADFNVLNFPNPHLLSLGFWPGGDRDGNPNVLAETTEQVARRLHETALRGYYRDVRVLRRRLTFSGVEDLIAGVEHRIYNTLYPSGKGEPVYQSCEQLIADLAAARTVLHDKHQGLFSDVLDRFILKVRVFGFHFAALDVRQDSRKHGEVWQFILKTWKQKFPWQDQVAFEQLDEAVRMERLLSTNYRLNPADYDDPFVQETLQSFIAIHNIQQRNGEKGCHRYVISNCQSALNVAEVLSLARLTMPTNDPAQDPGMPLQQVPLDIVPLFETIDDLAACDEIMRTLYTNPHYAGHLASRGNVQTIMLGFSDGTKDGGYLRANWSIYRAKEALSKISREFGVTVLFFDGRGGPPGRGGGNNVSYYAAHGAAIENRGIQVTIQGQTVSSTYGTISAAQYNIERLLTAGLGNSLFMGEKTRLPDSTRDTMEALADAAYEAYLKLKNHPQFVPYLEKMTPLKWYGQSNIASRPTKRGSQQGLRFEDLRAIPFVGAWAQMKQNVPGYYGLGSALEALMQKDPKGLKTLYEQSLFFRTLLENSMQSLSKSNFQVSTYIAQDPEFGAFWQLLSDEYQRTLDMLRKLSNKELLHENPNSRLSITLREKIVIPLITIQQYALQRLRSGDLSAEEAEICQKLVLRAMFGIINAARNAA